MIIDKTTLGLYTVVSGNDTEYKVMSIVDATYTLDKPMATITYELNNHGNEIAADNKNINIAYTLPVPTDENYVFKGWYIDSAFEHPVDASYVPTDDVTLYAKWSLKLTATINLNNGNDEVLYYLGDGDVLTLERPVYAGHAFAGWYTDSTFEVEWTNGSNVNANMTLYAKWDDPSPFYGTYNVAYSDSTSAGNFTKLSSVTGNVYFDEYGVVGGSYKNGLFANALTVVKYEPTTNKFVLKVETSSGAVTYVLGFRDADNDILFVYYYSSGSSSIDSAISTGIKSFFILAKDDNDIAANTKYSRFDWKHNMVIQYTRGEEILRYFVKEGKTFYTNVDVFDVANSSLDVDKCYKAKYIKVSKDDETIFEGGFAGSSGTTLMTSLDGLQGVYTNGEHKLLVYGTGLATVDGIDISYTAKENLLTAKYTVDDSLEYHELTLDKSTMTYVDVKPMASIIYDANEHGEAPESVSVNINVPSKTAGAIEAEGFIFRSWNTRSDGTGTSYKALSEITITSETTLYAIWDVAVKLTIKYGNGISDEVVTKYYANDTFTLTNPVEGNDKSLVFYGWYIDEGFTTSLTSYVITESMTVYGKWDTPYTTAGTYKGGEIYSKDGGNYAKNVDTSSLSSTLTISVTGVVTGTKKGNIATEYKNITDGVVMVGEQYFYVNTTYGILWTAYGSSKTDVSSNDTYVFFDTEKVTHVAYSGTSIYDSSNYMIWVELTLKDNSIVKVYGYKSVLHAGYDWSVKTNEAYKSSFVMSDETGTAICKFDYSNKTILVADGKGGTYTNDALTLGTILLDGYGTITFADDTTTDYTYDSSTGVITFVYQNRLYAITVLDSEYTQVEDIYKGTYTCEGASDLILDGKGHYSIGDETGVYYVDGSLVLMNSSTGATNKVVINTTNYTYSSKTVLEGKIFCGSSAYNYWDVFEFSDVNKVVVKQFYEESNYTGTSSIGSYYNKIGTFTISGDIVTISVDGTTIVFTYDSANNTLKCTSDGTKPQGGNAVGKTFKLYK